MGQNGTSGTSWHHAARVSLDWGSRGRWFKSSQPDDREPLSTQGFLAYLGQHGEAGGSRIRRFGVAVAGIWAVSRRLSWD